jgi:hypothetical protein
VAVDAAVAAYLARRIAKRSQLLHMSRRLIEIACVLS